MAICHICPYVSATSPNRDGLSWLACWAGDGRSPCTLFLSVTLSVKIQLYLCMLQIDCERYISVEKYSRHQVGEDRHGEEQQGTDKPAEKTE